MQSRFIRSMMDFLTKPRSRSFVCALVAVLALSGELSSLGATDDVSERVRAIFAQLKERSITTQEVEKQLAALSAEEAIPALVEQLSGNPDLQDTENRWPTPGRVWGYGHGRRRLAYLALRDHNGIQTDIGYEQFVACLSEPKYGSFCATTLIEKAPGEKQSDVVGHIGRYFGDLKIPDVDKDGIVFRLGRQGPSMAPYLEHMEAVFANREAGERLRWMAANAMLRIGGLGRALPHFQEIDPVGQKGVMTSLARFIVESDESCNYKPSAEYREARDGARKLVLKTMTSSDMEARKAALQSYTYVYGMDVLIIRSSEDYEWNPEPRSALEKMAKEDPDPELRNRAAEMMELGLDQVAAKIRRSLARIEKQRQREGAADTTLDQNGENQE